jgi:hypothetical protein
VVPRPVRQSGRSREESIGGDWSRAHALVNELETTDGMAVHAYLHRKEGSVSNAEYWYQRSGHTFHRPSLYDEWTALVEALLSKFDLNPSRPEKSKKLS